MWQSSIQSDDITPELTDTACFQKGWSIRAFSAGATRSQFGRCIQLQGQLYKKNKAGALTFSPTISETHLQKKYKNEHKPVEPVGQQREKKKNHLAVTQP